jgi:hypothetical protein
LRIASSDIDTGALPDGQAEVFGVLATMPGSETIVFGLVAPDNGFTGVDHHIRRAGRPQADADRHVKDTGIRQSRLAAEVR